MEIKMVRPQWERFTHKNGQFAFEFDATRGIVRCVNRGGTVEYNLAARIADAQKQVGDEIDTTATSAS